jgi:hypothetical protein
LLGFLIGRSDEGERAMPDDQTLTNLDQFINQAEQRLAAQRGRVRRMEDHGLDTRTAEVLMEALSQSLDALRQSRDALVSLNQVVRRAQGLANHDE